MCTNMTPYMHVCRVSVCITRTHAHTRTHTHTHAYTHTPTHAHARAHTHTQCHKEAYLALHNYLMIICSHYNVPAHAMSIYGHYRLVLFDNPQTTEVLKRLTWLENRLEKLLFARRRGRPAARGRRAQISRVS